MSSRQLKKLRAQEEARAAGKPIDDASSGEESDDVVDTRPRAKNPFAAFAALAQGEDDEDDEDKENNSEENHDAQEQTKGDGALEPQANQEVATSKIKKKKSKNKKKKKGKTPKVEDNTQDDDLDEIDRALKDLGVMAQGRTSDSSRPRMVSGEAVSYVKVDLDNLKVLNELRDIFGGEAIRAAQAEDDGTAQRPQGERVEGNPGMVMVDLETFLRADPPVPAGMVRRGGHGGTGREMSDALLKRNPFIQWKDAWPRATSGGLAMQQVKSAAQAAVSGIVEYSFVHNQAYVQLEADFFTIVLMHNHQPMIQFLKQHPYHISSLIQVSRIAKQNQDTALAGDLCERALFSFGRSTLSSFRQKLCEGKARLSFARPENRQFVLAGLYYIQSLVPRGTYRTALEWTKLFLSLMPRDDYSFILYLPVFALRAFEAKWLIDAFNTPPNVKGMFQGAIMSTPMREYIYTSLGLAYLQVGADEAALENVVVYMTRLPWLYATLFKTLNMDVPRVLWGITPRDEHENLYTQLYIHLMKDLWNESDAKSLLQRAVAKISEKPDVAKIDEAIPVTLRIARFVYLDDTPALMALVPNKMLHVTPNYGFDPLPPVPGENEFSNDIQQLPWITARNEDSTGHREGWRVEQLLRNRLGMMGVEFEDPEEDPDEDSEFASEQEEEVVDQPSQSNQADQQPSQPSAPSRPQSGMPGAWVEEVEDEEFTQ